MLNGILVVNKPSGFTSHDVVAKLRGICGTKKIGHGGTLDPMATGVLPVFIGGAVKAVDLVLSSDKAYDAEILFGTATDTGDRTGTIIEKMDVNINKQKVEAVLPSFLGIQNQLPPMYSAVKVNGQPLYKYARKGQTVERKLREITIFQVSCLDKPANPNCVWLHILCSKGTYIRTLVEDIGKALDVPATLNELHRTKAGIFQQNQAYSFTEIEASKNQGTLQNLLCPIENLFSNLPCVEVDENQAKRLINGAEVYGVNAKQGQCRICINNNFLGLGFVNNASNLQVQKILNKY